jgi:hypothetical protein
MYLNLGKGEIGEQKMERTSKSGDPRRRASEFLNSVGAT